MRLMKKKRREREGAREDTINKSLSVVMAVVLVSSVMMAFVPLAAANGDGITFKIKPCRGLPGEVLPYDVTMDTTGFTWLDLTIPEGFEAVAPGDGDLIAEISLWDTDENRYDITLTANGTGEIDLYCECGGAEAEYTFDASYGEGDTIEVSVRCWGDSFAKLTLPTTGCANGSLKLLSAKKTITKVKISIKGFVRNPATCGPYPFDLFVNGNHLEAGEGNGDAASSTVCIMYPGDVNGDCVVDILDIQLIVWGLNTQPGDEYWNYCADLNGDGKINVLDVYMWLRNRGNVYPCGT